MTSNPSPQSILQEIAQIDRMERGKVCMIRQGPDGPYYNLQCRENGKTCSRYLPRDQVEVANLHTANFRRFQELMEQYVQALSSISRSERQAGGKKKPKMPTSFSPKTRKSSS